MRQANSKTWETVAAAYERCAAREQRLDLLRTAAGGVETIGLSREGRPILAYRWSRSGDAAQPGVLLLSLLHPMEWIGLEANLALLEGWLQDASGPREEPAISLSARDQRPSVAETDALPAGVPIYSIPVANPDGFARVEKALREGRPRWVRGNAAGIDLNRNFPVGFRLRPRPLDLWPLYRPGPAPLSEPETAAIAAWIRGRPLRLALSLHSFGRWIFFPPSYTRREDGGTRLHQQVAAAALGRPPKVAVAVSGRAPASAPPSPRSPHTRDESPPATSAAGDSPQTSGGYRCRQLGRWSPFFRAHGTEIDYLAATGGALAYLVEISRGGFLRWGWRRAPHPFFAFNPPDPGRELAALLPILRRLAASAPDAS